VTSFTKTLKRERVDISDLVYKKAYSTEISFTKLVIDSSLSGNCMCVIIDNHKIKKWTWKYGSYQLSWY
jgi:hypothetical protein